MTKQEKYNELRTRIVAHCSLGTPPTLQDVLVAIRDTNAQPFIDFCNSIWRTNLTSTQELGSYEDFPHYNLTKPLEDQSEETLDFLLEVIK